MKVLAALSGGVDSAVAAARAVDAGHDVTAVHMALSSADTSDTYGCCTVDDRNDAAEVARLLGIPFEVWDLSETFKKIVVDDFLNEYRAGRTPNPCVRCNEFIKFRELLKRGIDHHFDAVATGHYARVIDGLDGRQLHRAVCNDKDQSYVLAVIGRDMLSRVMFPLGDMPTKAAVRAEAEQRGLPTSHKPDSFDICFIRDGNTKGFLRDHLGAQEGDIVSDEGEHLGTHEGAYAYTVGQRKGLGIEKPAADGRPRYVLSTDMSTNTVVVGAKELLSVSRIITKKPVILVDNDDPGLNGKPVTVQYRAHGRQVPTTVRLDDDGMTLDLIEPTRAVAPGQSAVIYDGTRVIAQATIIDAVRD